MAVGDGIMRALRERPTTLERWPKGVHEGMTISTREGHKGDAFYQKRVPKGRLTTSRPRGSSSPPGAMPTRSAPPSSRSSPGARTWGRSPSIRGRCGAPTSIIPMSCGSTWTRSPAPTSPTPLRSRGEARSLLEELGLTGYPKTSGGRGIHIYVRIEPRWTFTDVRHAAIAFGRELERQMPGRVTTKWWKEERGERVFVDYNQNARDRTIASPYSVRPRPGAPVSAPLRLGRARRGRARRAQRPVDAEPVRRRGRPVRGHRRHPSLAGAAARDVRVATRPRATVTCRTRPTIRRCRASRSGFSRAGRRRPRARRRSAARRRRAAPSCRRGPHRRAR